MRSRRVQVVMSTYNGEKYLREQIDSILSQKNVDVNIYIRDDGSLDGSRDIISSYEGNPKINYDFGENKGFVKSFMTALNSCGNADYYAFSDQDDVWLDNKLFTAISMLEKEDSQIPLLYCSTLQRVDEQLNYLEKQEYPGLIINLPSMLTRGRLAGCTFVFNNKLKELVKKNLMTEFHASHDSWVLLVCLACGGKVVFDKEPHILFRRYGENTSIDGGALISRVKYEFRYFGKYKNYRLETAKELLKSCDKNITSESKQFLEEVLSYKKNIGNRIGFAFSDEIDCGITISNIITAITILFGNY